MIDPPPPLALDVRPLLEKGHEPLPLILDTVDRLEKGQSLLLAAPFEPLPLYGVLRERGYSHRSKPLEEDGWEILFEPITENAVPDEESRVELDLRHLPPPSPLHEALEAMQALGREEVLTIHTRFRPVFLLEGLEEKGFDGESEEVGPGHWQTELWRLT